MLGFARTMTPEDEAAASALKPMLTRRHIYAALRAEGWSIRDIADKAGIRPSSVWLALSYHDPAICFHCKKASR